jgi:signal transduction histidine kinase
MVLNQNGLINNCHILVDSVRLRQVLNNLIGNAIKFTEKGYICFGYRQSAPNHLEFVVEDTGIGLSSDQQEIIFERFRQAETGHNRQYGGTGLGLTISRSLVQLMGGNMWVKSTEGEGSFFYFTIEYLPVEDEDVTIKTVK